MNTPTQLIMKRLTLLSALIVITAFSASAAMTSLADRFSLSDFKKALQEDSSPTKNSELAKEVLKRGVTFEYTSKRERDLREWGANDELLGAIYQSIFDENSEKKLFSKFFDDHKSKKREMRKSALETGKLYLSRFESSERFADRAEKLKKALRFLECEFDPSLGC